MRKSATATPQAARASASAELAWLRDGAILVNAGRAALLDREVFLAQLRTGRFRAYLDVFDEGPLPLDAPLRTLENVFLTPHIARDTTGMFLPGTLLAIDAPRRYFVAPAGMAP